MRSRPVPGRSTTGSGYSGDANRASTREASFRLEPRAERLIRLTELKKLIGKLRGFLARCERFLLLQSSKPRRSGRLSSRNREWARIDPARLAPQSKRRILF